MIDATDLERISGPLNDPLVQLLTETLEMMQPELRAIAAKAHEVKATAPMILGTTLMRSFDVDGTSAAEYFKRRSPSKWMRNLFGQGSQQVEAQVRAAIASGAWAIAGDIQRFTWSAPARWQWITKEDQKVCSQCGPLHEVIFKTHQEKAHWACRCDGVPAPAG